ncbi:MULTISPECIES: DUF512 domain-containing protein [unclassified Candidatus Frackibacter]|uniref:DUF512 domain-containing protein n=1 Tax=unclassified Candidatus Frackibacter TaxID=2648818 RepID=UPI00087E3D91|nr:MULTISPECIES: DUF512 domain-containing protein [unclassified Candidatus Frackibacter]SDC23759.1 4Fe-4S single cluster domain-containing protein [Candidatus Frackibacter sp. WG11]SEM48227.1 4Fe-4S single cluster domain-containing protein [Candidatus Frackibacter sp. WG12]SFL50157.1 4Fe-4S single cluster domain-containing protein [Candidatus Frackibacter sp. WG13]
MKYSSKQLIILSAQERNILPITSVCNLNCLFCSHYFNPEGVEVFNCGHQSLNEVKEVADFLDPQRKIVIGESITRIIEGEPFAHPKFNSILNYLRKRFPETTVQITTNGSYLNNKNVRVLKDLGLIELNLSLNSSQPIWRKKIMGDQNGKKVLKGIEELAKFEIPYHGSIVAMPMISGWDELEKTISFLDSNHAQTVRVFLPGYTKLTPSELQFDLELWEELSNYIKELNNRYRVPIMVEPPLLEDMNVKLKGVISGSPADISGFKKGDEIIKINQETVKTRVDAFNKLLNAKTAVIECKRSGQIIEISLEKESGDRPGIVLDYDISSKRIKKIEQIITSKVVKKVVLLTSVLGERIVKLGVEKIIDESLSEIEVKILPIKNKFFGGSIMAAGLLVADDFLDAIYEYQAEILEADLVFIPENPFNNWGNDLVGKSYEVIKDELDCEVALV